MRDLLARWWPWALALTSVVAAGLVVGPADSGVPLDPRSTAPGGARAVVQVLEELGRDVDVTTRPQDATAVLVLHDRLDEESRRGIEAWVEAGGRLVVADPGSLLLRDIGFGGRSVSDLVGPTRLAPDCDHPELEDVSAVQSATWTAFVPRAGDRSCFPTEGGAWLVRRSLGAGELVALGGADAFTNRRLGEADNALLLVRLLGDGGRIVVTDASPPGGGDATLGELVPDRVYLALAVLVLAFVLAAWSRGRRLGDPVEEPLPVRIPASELVLATAELMRRGDVRDAAGEALRGELRREAATRLGLPEDVPDEVLAERIAAWTGSNPDGVARALAPGPLTDDEALVRTARAVARLRRRLGSGPLASRGADEGADR